MYCSQCGKKVQENMLFCPFCGSPIVIPDQDEESAPAAPAFSDVGHQAVQAKAAKQAVPAGDFLTEAALEFEPEVQSEDGGFVPLNMEQAMEPSREAREARRENAPQAEISDLLSGQIHAEPVRLDGHSPNLSGAHRSEAARRNVRKSADTFVPQKRFNPNDIFLDSADYRDDEDDEDGRGQQTRRGRQSAGDSPGAVAAEGGGVHRDHAGGALGNGVEVQELLVGEPALLFHQLLLEEGEHGVAAAEAAGADPGEGQKEF